VTFDKPILVVDTETTGIDAVNDRLIELGIALFMPDGTVKHRGLARRFNPGIPIPPEATAVHGITDADVKNCQPFSAVADKIEVMFRGRDIAGYNLRALDLPLIDSELRRCGKKLDLKDTRIIDCFAIFGKKEPRKLEDAVKRYCNGAVHADAHGAGADAAATLDVLLGQLAAYPDLDSMTPDQLADFACLGDNKPADLAGKLYRDAAGDLFYNFGKYKGRRVQDEPGYADWMIRATSPGFPGSTVEALIAELERTQ
jgi:DNA polymerase III subunit epsilon